ncbi:hypothetical protein [Parasitella parasitica]|uniref:Uncharacterized protein n=1 Tax=Parasitella parasitica TaxID=35722 RepID=A0A0B7NFT7_9FUNG|nr:hypothetical protein [Parasitella parasitica]
MPESISQSDPSSSRSEMPEEPTTAEENAVICKWLNLIEYIKCLQENDLPWISEMIEKEGTTFILQKDGSPGHTGKIARD